MLLQGFGMCGISQGVTPVKATWALFTKICKTAVQWAFRVGDPGSCYPRDSYRNRRQSKRWNAVHSDRKRCRDVTAGCNREPTAQERNKDINMGVEKWGQMRWDWAKAWGRGKGYHRRKRKLTFQWHFVSTKIVCNGTKDQQWINER